MVKLMVNGDKLLVAWLMVLGVSFSRTQGEHTLPYAVHCIIDVYTLNIYIYLSG